MSNSYNPNKRNKIDNLRLLFEIVKSFISKKITLGDFVDSYEKLYENLFLKNNNLTIERLSEGTAFFFDQIHEEISFFEPDKEARVEHLDYLDEKQLFLNVKKIYGKLKNKFK